VLVKFPKEKEFFARKGTSSHDYKIIESIPGPLGGHYWQREETVSLASYEVWIYDYYSNKVIGHSTLNPVLEADSWHPADICGFMRMSLSAEK
jgi:hypothetical protein